MLKMNRILILCFCASFLTLNGQEYKKKGYLGKTNLIGVDFGAHLLFARHYKQTSSGVKELFQIFSPHIRVNYDLVISKRVSFGLNYQYHSLYIPTYRSRIKNIPESESTQNYLAEDISIENHSFGFDFKFFKKSLYAPIGVFYKLGFNYGFYRHKNDNYNLYGDIYSIDVYSDDKITSTIQFSNDLKHYIQLAFGIGNQIELFKNILLKYDATFNIPFFIDHGFQSTSDYFKNELFERPLNIEYSNNTLTNSYIARNSFIRQNLVVISIGLAYVL